MINDYSFIFIFDNNAFSYLEDMVVVILYWYRLQNDLTEIAIWLYNVLKLFGTHKKSQVMISSKIVLK